MQKPTVLFRRVRQLLFRKDVQVLDDAPTSFPGLNHVVEETALRCRKRVGEFADVILLGLGPSVGVQVPKDNLDGALGSHDGNLGRGPRVVNVSPQVLGSHDIVGTAVRFTGDDGDLGNGGLGVGVQELGTVPDDTVVLLRSSGQETGHVDESDDGDVEGVEEADETGGLDGGVDVEHTRRDERLVADDADGFAVHAGETHDDVLGKVGLDLEKVAVVDDALNDVLDVVGLGRVGGDDLVKNDIFTNTRQKKSQFLVEPCPQVKINSRGVLGLANRRLLAVAQRQEIHKSPQPAKRLNVVIKRKVRHTRLGGVCLGASQLLLRHNLVGHGLDDLGPGNKQVRGIANHHREIGKSGGVHGPAGAGAHDHGDLRDDAGGEHVLLEDVGVPAERVDAFLDTGTAGVVQADDGGTDEHGLVHDLVGKVRVSDFEKLSETRNPTLQIFWACILESEPP